MGTNELSLTDLLAPYREKITETWAEVLASDEVQIGRWVATGDLLNEAKAAGHNAGKKWMTEVFPLLCPGNKPFGLGKADKLKDIAGTLHHYFSRVVTAHFSQPVARGSLS
jgi:hypothetical protein